MLGLTERPVEPIGMLPRGSGSGTESALPIGMLSHDSGRGFRGPMPELSARAAPSAYHSASDGSQRRPFSSIEAQSVGLSVAGMSSLAERPVEPIGMLPQGSGSGTESALPNGMLSHDSGRGFQDALETGQLRGLSAPEMVRLL